MKKIFVLLLNIIWFSAHAQVIDTTQKINVIDTLKKDLFTLPDTVRHLHAKAWAMVPPAALVAYGASNFFLKPVRRLDVSIYNDINEDHPNFKHHPENYFQYTPAALVYGLNLVGVHGKNTFVDRTFIYAMAEGMMSLTTFALKKQLIGCGLMAPITIHFHQDIRLTPLPAPNLWRRSWAVNQ